VQPGEQCDDGNLNAGDCCTATCQIEPSCEIEPNEWCTQATGPYTATAASDLILKGSLESATDLDFFTFELLATSDLRIETFDDGGPGSCVSLDTQLQFHNADCWQIASDDNGGLGDCSMLDATTNPALRQLPAGTYGLRVTGSASDSASSAYQVRISVLSVCGNGIKEPNEMCDGGEDCTSACKYWVERTCNDGIDEDGDGGIDCADPDCAFACSNPACAAGQVLVSHQVQTLGQVIDNLATYIWEVEFKQPGTVQRAAVQLNISHTWNEDLDISLRSPANTTIELSTDNGGPTDNYVNTTFADSCAASIASAVGPFTGCFYPEQPLATFNGQPANGPWSLVVADDTAPDPGAMNSWSIALCVAP
jgi:cysteine-rich repeat protein